MTTTKDLRATLADTLAIAATKERRPLIRKLFAFELSVAYDRRWLAAAVEASPICGDGPKQIRVQGNARSIAASMDEDTMVWVLHAKAMGLGAAELNSRLGQVMTAIENPSGYGKRSDSRKSKTGWTFGRPYELTDGIALNCRREIMGKAPFTEPTPTPRPLVTPPAKPSAPSVAAHAAPAVAHASHPRKETAAMSTETAVAESGPVRIPEELGLGEIVLGLMVLKRDFPAVPVNDMLAAAKCVVDCKATLNRLAAAADLAAKRKPLESTQRVELAAEVVPFVTKVGELLMGEKTPAEARSEAGALTVPEKGQRTFIDSVLRAGGLPDIATLVGRINESDRTILEMRGKLEETTKQMEALRKRASTPSVTKAEAKGAAPEGELVWRKAWEVFGITTGKAVFDFDVPTWVWAGEHPLVPVKDPDYVWRPFELLRVLYALVSNKRCYLHGHTGTGKTTLLEQVAAWLSYPFMALNFDSEITRMDLIGRDVIEANEGASVSRFVDGAIPQAMSQPMLMCYDEIDACRPDVAYVMQRVFEGNGLVLPEDGGRVVHPHPMYRAFATGNSVGQGDEHGMYGAVRPQSLALLDRFTVWVHVDYLGEADRMKLIRKAAPGLSEDMARRLGQYVSEHLEAFTTAKVMQPLSPRGFMSMAEMLEFYVSVMPDAGEAAKQALGASVVDRATQQDRAVLMGIVSRLF